MLENRESKATCCRFKHLTGYWNMILVCQFSACKGVIRSAVQQKMHHLTALRERQGTENVRPAPIKLGSELMYSCDWETKWSSGAHRGPESLLWSKVLTCFTWFRWKFTDDTGLNSVDFGFLNSNGRSPKILDVANFFWTTHLVGALRGNLWRLPIPNGRNF